MLDTRGVAKRSTAASLFDNASAISVIESMTTNNVVPSPRKAPAKATTTRGRGSARVTRGAGRGAASASKADLSTTVRHSLNNRDFS